MKRESVKWIDENQNLIADINDSIWSYAEVGYKEFKSAELLKKVLDDKGFSIIDNIGGIPTAFMATWGEGNPKIGFLAEYDALPGMSQKVSASQEEIEEGAPGHGCSHNTLGAGTLGAVLGLQEEMKKDNLAGTIVFYGCPAEELLSGKVFMAREGVFDDLDLAMTWHPASTNMVFNVPFIAQNQMKFNFKGITAHAAANPQDGRSALDAVELMNVGANYLREHIVDKARLHYTITDGGGAPNVVPKTAQVWYYIRAPLREEVEDLYARLIKVAEGAAMMTETEMEIEFISGCYQPLLNGSIAKVLHESMLEAGPIEWSEEDYRLAEEIDKTLSLKMKRQTGYMFGITDGLESTTLIGSLPEKVFTSNEPLAGSTDVGDVSWITPLAQIMTACSTFGTPAHSWQQVAQSGSSISHKGAALAAKTMAIAGSRYLKSPELVKEAREEFMNKIKGEQYVCPIPADVNAPIDN